MDFLKLTEDQLSVDFILKLVSSEKCGAVSIFVGTTRDNFEGKEVKSLEYEAYESMALKVMKDMCTTIRNKWNEVYNIAIYHRLGIVPVLEASVVIAISSPHRVESQAAVQYCIDNLKVNEFVKRRIREDDSPVVILDPHMIQINASCSEMKERIKKFTDWKREQININNIQDFTVHKSEVDASEEESDTCARVDAILIKSKDSKSHFKVLRTENTWGPQTKVEIATSQKDNIKSELDPDLPSGSMFGIEERISSVEDKLNLIKPISMDIYDRLKKIEVKLLELESVSPEYVQFWSKKTNYAESCDSESETYTQKRTRFSSEDIWKKMKQLEN